MNFFFPAKKTPREAIRELLFKLLLDSKVARVYSDQPEYMELNSVYEYLVILRPHILEQIAAGDEDNIWGKSLRQNDKDAEGIIFKHRHLL